MKKLLKGLSLKHESKGLSENIKIAKVGGGAAKTARDEIEKNLGEKIVTKSNKLSYEYENEKLLEKIKKGVREYE